MLSFASCSVLWPFSPFALTSTRASSSSYFVSFVLPFRFRYLVFIFQFVLSPFMFGVRAFFFLFLFAFVNFAATLDAAFGRELFVCIFAV